MWPVLLIILLILFSVLFYEYFVKPLYFWDRRNVPNIKGWPIIGKQAALLSRRMAPMEWIKVAYNEFPDKRYSGTTQLNRPILLLRDPDLITQITVKDFDHFVNRMVLITEEVDELMGKSLLFQKNEGWRSMRCTLSPAFTGSKMRGMFSLISDCAEQFTDYFAGKGSNTIAIETKEVVTRFTNDVIASCAFGVTCNSLSSKNNEFYLMGKKISNFGFERMLKLMIYGMMPIVTKFISLPVFSKAVNNFFRTIVNETISYREKHSIIRPDMLHLLMEAKKGTLQYVEENQSKDTGFATVDEHTIGKQAKNMKTEITNEDITAQAIVFFFAGFEPVSTGISFLLHELAIQPDVQSRLRDEIDAVYATNGKLTYDNVLGMKYLDMVVSETLRKWPAVPILHRTCTKQYVIKATNEDETDLTLQKGETLFIPTIALHYDEKHYPDPHRFDPERFSDKNKHKVKQNTYLPFGAGPRNCIGSRFALLEMKIFICTFMSRFEIVPIEKTPRKIKLKWTITLAPDTNFWVGFKPRFNNAKPFY